MTLVLGIPSKGRLQEQAAAFFADSGVPIRQTGGDRGYRGCIAGAPDIEVRLVSAAEIATGLASGELHMGVTGEDLLHETISDIAAVIHPTRRLGFGHADLVVAAPRSWFDVDTIEDLDEVAAEFPSRYGRALKVATKYMSLARRFFAGRADYRVIESLGATEGAPASGAADVIVDITTSGATLAANGLKVLTGGVLLKSEALLAASLKACWTAQERAAAALMLDAIEARARARASVILHLADCSDRPALAVLADRFGCVVRAGGEIVCPADQSLSACRHLVAAGHGPVSVTAPEYLFQTPNQTLDALLARLPGA
jgi:ATP phosphoribosyltransferase